MTELFHWHRYFCRFLRYQILCIGCDEKVFLFAGIVYLLLFAVDISIEMEEDKKAIC